MIQYKNTLRHRWQRTKNPFLKTSINRLSKQIKWELDKIRFDNYRKFAENLIPGDKNLWKETKRLIGLKTEIYPLIHRTETANTDEEKCQLLARYLHNKFTDNNTTDKDIEENVHNYLNTPMTTAEKNIDHITPYEINTIIRRLPTNKSPGDDLIPNLVLKNLPQKSIALMTSVFNACLRWGYFPKMWKNAIVLVFHKPGKPKEDPDSYRAISLLNTVAKVFEKCVEKRLRRHLEENNIIPQHQFGFKPHYSAVHQVQRVSETILKAFEGKKYTAAAFLDVKAAFDTVWHKGLLYKLKKTWPPSYLLDLITSFLEERTFQVRVNNSMSRRMNITCGVPQGAVLSPLLFNLYCHDIPDPPGATLALFADDTLVMSQGEKLEATIADLQSSLDCISSWFRKWRLSLNPMKTEAKIFALKHYDERTSPSLRIGQLQVPWNPRDQSVRYLGVHLDSRLTWRLHINIKLQLTHTRLRLLYPLLNRKTPLRYNCATLLYKTLLRPLLTYACPVWYGTSNTNRRRLQTFQNKTLRIILNAPPFIRNTQIHRELGVAQFAEYIQELTQRHYERLSSLEAANYYQIGEKIARRLKPRSFQDLFH